MARWWSMCATCPTPRRPPGMPPRFSAAFLPRERLCPRARLRFPAAAEQFDELDSTNRLAAERILAAWDAGRSPERTLITAARQTAGRGQHGRRWESPPGGLYFSAVVERVPAEFRDRLALVAGLAVARTLCAADVPAMIRWPNDVLIDGKKVAGILCEALARGEHWAAIIGVGVNVSTDIGPAFPRSSALRHQSPRPSPPNPGWPSGALRSARAFALHPGRALECAYDSPRARPRPPDL